MNILTIIPARGGSKGIPRKNIRLLGGKPLIAWSIEVALTTPGMGRVVVSTDDEEISDVARQWGAEVVARPVEISGDRASSESALLHVLDHLRDQEQYDPDLVVFLQATSPLRRQDDIRKAIDTLLSEQADSLFSSRHIEGFVWRRIGNEVTPVNYDPTTRKRRQDLDERIIEENGSIYVFKPSVLRRYGSRLGGKIATWQMDELDSFQVDMLEDISRMEKLLELRPAGQGRVDLSVVKLMVLDFDGVLTDNRVLVDQEGREAVLCSRGDSLGIERARQAGLEFVVLSKETNTVVEARCRKLNITCISACDAKRERLQALAAERSLSLTEIGYTGNDINDLECMRIVGVPIAVADAVPSVLQAARLITKARGGCGALREITDLWLSAHHKQGL